MSYFRGGNNSSWDMRRTEYNRTVCPLWVAGETLSQVEQFKYLRVFLLSIEQKLVCEIDGRIGAASAAMRSLYWSVLVKKELSCKEKISILRSLFAASPLVTSFGKSP